MIWVKGRNKTPWGCLKCEEALARFESVYARLAEVGKGMRIDEECVFEKQKDFDFQIEAVKVVVIAWVVSVRCELWMLSKSM